MTNHKLRRIESAADRVVFKGPIASGGGEHNYLCAGCGTAVLERVEVRQPSAAVYECPSCGTLNVVREGVGLSDEAAERLERWFGPTCERFSKDRRKGPR
jgi:predicted RNA-binding Zn-ribbon protein involved in translation (DUF1610 family)